MLTRTPALPAWSHSNACTAVALPSSVCSRQTNPGAVSATAFTGSRTATKSGSSGLSSGSESSQPFMVTEYADGPSLSEYIDTGGPLGADMLYGLATGLAEALAAIHAGPAGYSVVGRPAGPDSASVEDVWWSGSLTSWIRAQDMNVTTGSTQVLAIAADPHGFVSVGSHDHQPAV